MCRNLSQKRVKVRDGDRVGLGLGLGLQKDLHIKCIVTLHNNIVMMCQHTCICKYTVVRDTSCEGLPFGVCSSVVERNDHALILIRTHLSARALNCEGRAVKK